MGKTIKVHNKIFAPFIDENQIQQRIKEIASEITQSVKGETPLFLCVLNGAFMYAAELLKRIEEPCEVSFVKFSSYQGTNSTGVMKQFIGLNEDIQGRTIVVIEDIVDSGFTMKHMLETLREAGAGRIIVTTLLSKPSALKVPVQIDYVCFEIPNDFVVGYGLDYDGVGRNMPGIYKVVE